MSAFPDALRKCKAGRLAVNRLRLMSESLMKSGVRWLDTVFLSRWSGRLMKSGVEPPHSINSLGRDLHGGIAPAALTDCIYGADAEPVATAAFQVINRLARSSRDAPVAPACIRGWIVALFNYVALGAEHWLP